MIDSVAVPYCEVPWDVRTRLVATIVSKLAGSKTILVVIASTNILSTVTSGNSAATALATSSQSTIPFRCALLFVTTVNSLRGRFRAVSNANRMMRSTPCREKIDTSVATSHGLPACERPPWPAYSPSLFSRMITQSRSPVLHFRRGDSVPRKTRVGRTLAYCWRGWQIARRRPQSEMWSGTSGFVRMVEMKVWGDELHYVRTWCTNGAEENRIVLL